MAEQRYQGLDPEKYIIQVRNLVKTYNGVNVTNHLDLDFPRGKVTVIMGGSGCGKSTLLKQLIGAVTPEEGAIYIDGKDITRMNEAELNETRKTFGMLFQSGALLNSLTVAENIALPLREHTDFDDAMIDIMVTMRLEQVGLRGAGDLSPGQLSGGMIKRIALARAAILDPKIIFYDEPSAGLDPISIGVIDKLMVDYSKKMGITSIVVTHELTSAFRIADQIIVLFGGECIAQGPPEAIQNSEDPRITQFINGQPEGPIPFSRSKIDFHEELIQKHNL